jgi:hypothetical protein
MHATVMPVTPTSYTLECNDHGGQAAVTSLTFPTLTAIRAESVYILAG